MGEETSGLRGQRRLRHVTRKCKIYIALRDASADEHGILRVIDESGEDYLYPKALFCPIALPLAMKKAILAA